LTIVPLRGARWIVTTKFANFLAEVPFTMLFRSKYSVMIKPTFEYWQDGHTTARTETGLTLGVAENHYWFMGCQLNFGYAF
jgi:hypothetical protein